MKTNPLTLSPDSVKSILGEFGIQAGFVALHKLGGGTKNQNYRLETNDGSYFLRVRHEAFSNRDAIQFDHELMQHLQRKGIGAPNPVRPPTGPTWLDWQNQIIELFPFIEAGAAFQQMSLDQLAHAGRALGAFHQAVRDFQPSVAKPAFRIDPPELAEARIRALISNRNHPEDQRLAAYVLGQLALAKKHLPDEAFFNLPCLIIHGDFHPGNVKFLGNQVAGFFDLDWASWQPRLFDIAYGLLFFAAIRATEIDGSDIYSLTQTCLPSISRSLIFLDGYLESVTLESREVEFIPDFMRISWICCRTDGSQKVPESERWTFFRNEIEQPLLWLDHNELNMIEAIKERL